MTRIERAAIALVALVSVHCAHTEKQAVSAPPAPVDARAVLSRLDVERVTIATFPRKVLYSWTKDAGARWLATQDPPRLLRIQIQKHPPDDAWYDVHLRASDDDEMRTLLSSKPFDVVRWAWTNVWGACDGIENERYGDQLIRIELRDDAVFAVFVPRTDDGLGGAVDESNPYRLGMPEWSFVDLKGAKVERSEALAHPERLAGVFHHSPSRAKTANASSASTGAWVGMREIVLVNERAIASWSIGDPSAIAALDDGARFVRAFRRLGVLPLAGANDPSFVGDLMLRAGARSDVGGLDAESSWLLGLPFPRPRYRDLARIASILEAARDAQRFHRVVGR